MEDPSEEWEIQEYSSSDVSNSKVRWIMDKGLSIGKKIAITSVVISSAPLIIPPLVVISALVYAFSVPYGLVFASYACTEKLMSKLLPGPKSSLMLDYETLAKGEIEEFGFGGDILEEAEKVQMEDMKGCGEYCREGDENNYQELVEEINDEKDWGREEHVGEYLELKANAYGRKSVEKGDEEITNDVDEIVKEEGYEKEAVEDLDGKDKVSLVGRIKSEQLVDDVHQVVVVVGKAGKNGDVIAAGVVERGRADEVNTYNEEEDLTRGTTGLLQKVRDESDDGDRVGKDKQQTKEISETIKDVDQRNLALAAEMEKPSEVKSMKLGKLIGKMKGGKKRNKGPKQNQEILERITQKNVDVVYGVVEQVVETGSTIEVKRAEKNPQKVVIEEPIVNINRPVNGNIFVEVPDRNGAGTKFSHTTDENPEEYQNISAHTPEINEGSLKHHVLAEVPESKCAGIETVMPSSKVPLSEKEIWKHIEALRTIMGYKAAPRATCVEEIKALYIFTGVVPPASSSYKYPSDLVEMMDRLQFLMSIVGVK